ncbi:hypothetical protein C0993_004280, partial [Termitomyces sp. T159_Od127]
RDFHHKLSEQQDKQQKTVFLNPHTCALDLARNISSPLAQYIIKTMAKKAHKHNDSPSDSGIELHIGSDRLRKSNALFTTQQLIESIEQNRTVVAVRGQVSSLKENTQAIC